MGLLRRVLFNKKSKEILPKPLGNLAIESSKRFLKNKNNVRNSFGQQFYPPLLKYSTCSSKISGNKIGRHQYHEDIEKAMNQQIQTEFNASYAYLSMSVYFGRTDIALPGCQGFFYDMYIEETEHAVVFMNYQLMRGGQVVLMGIETPQIDWGSIDKAFEAGLQLEETVKEV